jgi:uncharacterized protein YdaU (DUF1376 family)
LQRTRLAEFPAFPLWTDAYLGDTTHLTTIEHGAYLLLRMVMWRSKARALPNDDALLAKYAKLSPLQWGRIKPTILQFFDLEAGSLVQHRLTDEWDAVRRNSKRQSDKAKARWLKTKKPVEPRQSHGNAESMPPFPYPSHTSPSGPP